MPFTEIQAGSYLFMDKSYEGIGSKDGSDKYLDFQSCLKVITTVISKPNQNRAVVDAGMKTLSIDSGMPKVDRFENVEYRSGGDEHGILDLPNNFNGLEIGEKIIVTPSHCDTTLNQFDKLYGIRGNKVEKEWEIKGRGRSD